MKIKICGLNPTRDVQLCINLKINFLGFVFYKKSPRNIINLKDINTLKKYNPGKSVYVAVCVDPDDNFIKKNILGNFEYIQLHGSETVERVNEIKKMGVKVIKAIKIKEEKDIDLYKKYEDKVDLILFDSKSMEKSQVQEQNVCQAESTTAESSKIDRTNSIEGEQNKRTLSENLIDDTPKTQ